MAEDSKKRAGRLKPGPRTYVLAALVLLALAGVMIFSVLHDTKPAEPDSQEWVAFQVVQGETASGITKKLEEAGIIDNPTAFKLYLRTHDVGSKLRAGTYKLSPSMTTEEIVYELLNGVGEMISFTIPEGYTLRDIADTLEQQDIMSQETFWNQVKTYDISQYPYMTDCPDDTHRLEGFLFPDTYFIAKDTAPEKIIGMMLERFDAVWQSMPANNSGLSAYDTMILASMIESEARFDNERSTIASVYLNRLGKGMLMQCDATILYGMPERKTQLTFADYKYETIYNTYLHQGFPPTPISNPGAASIQAAHQPEQTDYLFYLWDRVDNDGHIFSKTYEEHQSHMKKLGY